MSLRISLFPESRISFNLTNRPTSLGAAHHRGTGLAVSCADQPCLSTLKEIVQHDNYVYDYYPTSARHILQSRILSSKIYVEKKGLQKRFLVPPLLKYGNLLVCIAPKFYFLIERKRVFFNTMSKQELIVQTSNSWKIPEGVFRSIWWGLAPRGKIGR